MARPVYINNLAVFMPNKPISNDEMESVLGQAGERPSRARRIILRNNGIKTRYYAIDPVTGKSNYTNAQLAASAIKKLAENDLALSDIQCLAASTSMADQVMPGHAVMVQGELGNPPSEVVTTSGVCLCGITALKYAYMSVSSGLHDIAVAAASETASNIMRGYQFEPELESRVNDLEHHSELAFEKDFLRWMLSDGAGSALLQPSPNKDGISLQIEWIDIRSYANEQEVCMYAGGEKMDGKLKGWTQYLPNEREEQSVMSVKQDVRLLNDKVIHYTVERTLSDILEKRQLTPSDIDYFLPHYSSEFFRQKVYDGLKNIGFEITFDKWFTNLTTMGNTGSASIFIMLEELFHSGKLQKGQKLLCYIPESGRFSSSFMLLSVV
jgi:3-oxoacyl-[acyl-carrier-protein] synthase III